MKSHIENRPNRTDAGLFSQLIAVTAAVVLGFTVLVMTGCTTGTNNTTVKVESGLIPSVNVAMSVWKTRVEAGKATQAQVDQVHALYDLYYAAQLDLKAALEKSVVSKSPADEAAVTVAIAKSKASETTLLNTVNTLVK